MTHLGRWSRASSKHKKVIHGKDEVLLGVGTGG